MDRSPGYSVFDSGLDAAGQEAAVALDEALRDLDVRNEKRRAKMVSVR